MGKAYLTMAFVLVGSLGYAHAQTLPADEVQINISGYFDSFDVSVIYPNVAVTKKVSESTSITARYLVDMVSAASIRNAMSTTTPVRVDVVTSASGRRRGEEGPSFDDVRQQYGFGITQLIAGRTLSVNSIYSAEHDYTSATVAGTFTQWFANKNTSLELGAVHSWDKVFPATKTWKRDHDVQSFSANMSQIFSTRLLAQVLTSYTKETGHLSDDYLQIPIQVGGNIIQYDPVHPDSRTRKAAALRLKYRLTEKSSLQLGYRYYWDDWDVTSHTFSTNFQRYLSSNIILGIGLRNYVQSRAFFFKPDYDRLETYRTNDAKLDSGYSNELQWNLTINGGGRHNLLSIFNDEHLQYNLSVNIYQRHTDTPYWFNNQKNLISTNFNVGIRYRF